MTAVLRLIEGSPRDVQIFLCEAIPGYRGPERASEVLTAPGEFFPVLEGGEYRLIHRNSVVSMTIALVDELAGELGVEDLAGDLATLRTVEIACRNGPALRGTLLYLMPEGQRRPLDFLNQPDSIVSLRAAERVHLIRKQFIVDVVER